MRFEIGDGFAFVSGHHAAASGMTVDHLTPKLTYDNVLRMVKTISKIGNSRGIIFDSALLQLAHLKEGDQVNVEVHSGGTITITPIDLKTIEKEEAEEAAKQIIADNDELFRRLS